MKKKVLIISVSAGAGHVRAAQALEKTARQYFPNMDVRHIDMMDYVTRTVRTAIVDVYDMLITSAPSVWRALYDAADEETRMKRFYSLVQSFNRLNARKFYTLVRDVAPDHIICTHSFPAQVLRQAKEQEIATVPLSVVITDYGLHRFWIVPDAATYFCATERTAWKLKRTGARDVQVTGIPVDPSFYLAKNVDALREELNVPSGVPIALMLSGGVGNVSTDQLIAALANEAGNTALHVVAVSGKNKKLFERLSKLAGTLHGRVTLQLVGWTDRMEEYMRVADVVITKPGGMTTSECLALEKPMIIVQPIPGQEERNAEYLLEHGHAVVAHTTEDLLYAIEHLRPRRSHKTKDVRTAAAYTILNHIQTPR